MTLDLTCPRLDGLAVGFGLAIRRLASTATLAMRTRTLSPVHVARPAPRQLRSASRDRIATMSIISSKRPPNRDTRIYEAVRFHHYRLQEVADHLGLHFSTISAIANREASRIRK